MIDGIITEEKVLIEVIWVSSCYDGGEYSPKHLVKKLNSNTILCCIFYLNVILDLPVLYTQLRCQSNIEQFRMVECISVRWLNIDIHEIFLVFQKLWCCQWIFLSPFDGY